MNMICLKQILIEHYPVGLEFLCLMVCVCCRFGPGLVIYWFGFVEELDIDSGVLINDHLPVEDIVYYDTKPYKMKYQRLKEDVAIQFDAEDFEAYQANCAEKERRRREFQEFLRKADEEPDESEGWQQYFRDHDNYKKNRRRWSEEERKEFWSDEREARRTITFKRRAEKFQRLVSSVDTRY
jgi:hypothetical protein